MKRLVAIIAVALCISVAYAQSVEDRVRLLAQKCDSLSVLLSSYRSEYANKESAHDSISLKIVNTEAELQQLYSTYCQAKSALSKELGDSLFKAFISAKNRPSKESVQEDKSFKTKSYNFTTNTKRDLVANDFFVSQLTDNDYKTLSQAQQAEKRANELVAEYSRRHAELLGLQRYYMEVPTPQEADSLAHIFKGKVASFAQLDKELSGAISTFYFNKNYIYDLLMERRGESAMLDLSASLASSAEREIERSSGQYISDVLTHYHIRKKAITEYELRLAELISAGNAHDSLKVVAGRLKNYDYKLSQITLQRRSFIIYEPIEIKGTTFYNANNPIPRTKTYDYGTIYRIRIGLFQRKPNISALRGIAPLSCTDAYNKGLFAYFVGGFRTEQEAKEGADHLKKIGFKEPIIAVWVDGEYYPTIEDMHRSASRYNVEISGITSLTDDIKAKIIAHESDCTISRIGSTFVVGSFGSKADAEVVATDIQNTNGGISVKVTKIQ